jgi:hypothetical protein
LGQSLPPSLSPEFCATFQFQSGLICVNAFERISLSLARMRHLHCRIRTRVEGGCDRGIAGMRYGPEQQGGRDGK